MIDSRIRRELLMTLMRLFPRVLLATCVAGGLSAIGVPWAGLVSAILFILLSALAAVLLWRLP